MDQLREGERLDSAQPWDSARRLREPVAWTSLALAAVGLAIGAWELLGLPGSARIAVAISVRVPSSPASQGTVTTSAVRAAASFGTRASAVAPDFVGVELLALPIVSVILVAFAGGLTARARQVVETALAIQIITLGLGVLCWFAALGAHERAGIWFIADASELAIVATGLAFTVAVRHSRALRPVAPRFEDFLDDDEDFEVLSGEVAGAAFEDVPDDYEGFGKQSS